MGKLLLGFVVVLNFLTIKIVEASEKDLYDFLWLDPDKKVYVLQNKIFKKKKSFYFDGGYVAGQSGEFQSTNGFKITSGFYFKEEWAVEAHYITYKNKNNTAFENLQAVNSSVPFVRRPTSSYGALLIWSPFYGKINTFNKIFYFDWSFGLGYGVFKTESNRESVEDTANNSYKAESYGTVIAKTAFRFHVTPRLHVNLELLRNNYLAPGPKITGRADEDKWRSNTDLIFSVGLSF